MNILNTQPWICLVEAYGNKIDPLPEVNELLNVLSAWRARRVLCELEYKIEDRPNVFSEIGDVLIK